MGRLLKKKPASKKKKVSGGGASGPGPATSGAKSTVSSNRSSLEGKKPSLMSKIASPAAAKTPLVSRSPHFVQQGIQFLREVKVELKKVTWPTRKQTIGSTVVVLILVMILSLFLGTVDIGLSSLISTVLN